jgi:tungstate transport system substrate-binding protein
LLPEAGWKEMRRSGERDGMRSFARRLALLVTLGLGFTTPLALSAAEPSVILATTTSTQDTGLLDVLVPAFEKASGLQVKTIAVGTGAALAMGERGDADVLLVHAPGVEEAYMAKGRGISRALVMHNAFIVVGPVADPAHVHGSPTAQVAFGAIARAQVPFVSRGDDSGTNIKELALWKAAGADPAGSWYIKTGSGMADTLHVASQKAAYTLTDDGTFLSQRATLSLVPLVEDAKDLRNIYHVIVVKPIPGRVSNEPGGEAFARFVTSADGQRIIATYGREKFGRPLFTPDAGKAE